MNISVSYRDSKNPTVSITFTKRQFDLLTALIGNTTTHEKVNVINQSTFIQNTRSTNAQEVADTLDYFAMMDIRGGLYPNILKIVEFVYDKAERGAAAKWRNVHVTSEDHIYIEGLEDGKTFKCFLKSKITGGKIITVKQ